MRDRPTNRTALGLRAIGIYKLAKAVVFVAAGIYVTRLVPGDAVGGLLRFAARLRLDPENRLVQSAIARLAGVNERHLDAIGLGVVVYGLLYAVEGVGLILKRRWAEWIVVASTSLLVPFEGYEVFQRPGFLRIGVLLVNLLIVAFLVFRLRKGTTERILMKTSTDRDPFLQAAIDEAKLGLAEGGIPIGSVLVIDGVIVGRGHNQRVQRASTILHAEMDALENAGRLRSADYQKATLYSTLSPCDMCSGASLLYKIPRIVIGENRTFRGPEDLLKARGVVLEIRDDPECIALMNAFIAARPELWNEDIGV